MDRKEIQVLKEQLESKALLDLLVQMDYKDCKVILDLLDSNIIQVLK